MQHKKRVLSIALIGVLLAVIGYLLPYYLQLSDDQIWLHRTNSLQKLHQFESRYQHFEVDLVYRDTGDFEVSHDIDGSSSIFLRDYLAYLATGDTKLWLDIKNLNTHNQAAALRTLQALCATHGFSPDRLIIESGNPEALRLFSQAGLYTSYYLPIDQLTERSAAEQATVFAHINQAVAQGGIDAVSFWGPYYPEVKDYLLHPVDLLIWEHRVAKAFLPLLHRRRQILNDTAVHVILVKEKGDYHL